MTLASTGGEAPRPVPSPHMDARRSLGDAGEEEAVRHLVRLGHADPRPELPDALRRARRRQRHGRTCLVFCEVKTRTAGGRRGPATALEAVGPAKRRRLRLMAREWFRLRGPSHGRLPEAVRFDAVGVVARHPGEARRPRPRRRRLLGRAACTRSTRTTSGAAERSRSPGSPPGAPGSSSRRSSRSPSPGWRSAARRMKRSRATFASTDAPAMAALRESPPTTARCSIPKSGTRKPSTRQIASGGAIRTSACRSAARFVLWRPRESMPRTHRETITAFAAARITSG